MRTLMNHPMALAAAGAILLALFGYVVGDLLLLGPVNELQGRQLGKLEQEIENMARARGVSDEELARMRDPEAMRRAVLDAQPGSAPPAEPGALKRIDFHPPPDPGPNLALIGAAVGGGVVVALGGLAFVLFGRREEPPGDAEEPPQA